MCDDSIGVCDEWVMISHSALVRGRTYACILWAPNVEQSRDLRKTKNIVNERSGWGPETKYFFSWNRLVIFYTGVFILLFEVIFFVAILFSSLMTLKPTYIYLYLPSAAIDLTCYCPEDASLFVNVFLCLRMRYWEHYYDCFWYITINHHRQRNTWLNLIKICIDVQD